MKKTLLPKWFEGTLHKKGGIVYCYSKECKLNNIELSMFDLIKGASLVLDMKHRSNWKEIEAKHKENHKFGFFTRFPEAQAAANKLLNDKIGKKLKIMKSTFENSSNDENELNKMETKLHLHNTGKYEIDIIQKGHAWFRKYNPKAYKICFNP